MARFILAIGSLLIFVTTNAVFAEPLTPSHGELDDQAQSIKQEALEVNQELLLLQEKTLSPETALVTVFLVIESKNKPPSTTSGLEVKLLLDGDVVANHTYTQLERDALYRGGFHRVYLGNLAVGAHELIAEVSDVTSTPRIEERAKFTFNKLWQRKSLKLFLDLHRKSPELSIQEWQ